jgi:ABC-type transporter Mla subunit MlaD
MTAPATNFKLGLFALAAMVAVAVAVLALGLHTGRTPTIEYHTLFDESVQGLDIGASVDFRGVQIGNVARIEIAGDQRVDVTLAIASRSSVQLGLAAAPPRVRARLSSQGLTGVKLVDLDLADPGDKDAVATPISASGGRYLPARPSLAKQLEDEGLRLSRSLPALVDDARLILRRLDTALDDIHTQHLPEHLVALIERTRGALEDLRRLAPRAGAVLQGVDKVAGESAGAIEAVRRILARLDGDHGLAASAHRASESIGELGQRAVESTGEIEQAVRDVGDAARILRAFIEELGRDPEMLLKGRAPAGRP